jgi:3-hydroxybenzoate 6-monooxygenase
MNQSSIIIAGGGIGGLTTAITVALTGRPIILVERAPRFEPIGYGIQIGPNAMHVFERLGLLDKVLAHCVIPDKGMLSDALTNETIVELPMGDTMTNRFGQPYAVIHRGDLHEVLLETCNALTNIELRNDFEVKEMTDSGSQVMIESMTGERVTGCALVAADGIWSTLRNQLFPGTPEPFTSRYAAFRGLLPVEDVKPHLVKNVVNIRCGNDFHMIHYMLRNGTLFNVVAGMRVPDHIAMDDKEKVVTEFESIFADGCSEIGELLQYIDRSRYWAVSNLVPIHKWVKGRVALIGDSAHAMVQAMAQGACQAIEDAFVIAKHIDSNAPIETAFERYEQERRLRATYVQYRSLYMWELIHAKGGWRDLRTAMLNAVGGDEVLSQLEWLYSQAPGSKLEDQLDWAPRSTISA